MEDSEQTDIEIIRVAKTAVINMHGRLLVLTRGASDEHGPGKSDFPGGQIEVGETAREAAIREAREETHLDLGSVTMESVCQISTVVTRGEKIIKFVRNFFVARVKEPEIILSDEHQGFDWMSPDDAREVLGGSPQKLVCLDRIDELDLETQTLTKS